VRTRLTARAALAAAPVLCFASSAFGQAATPAAVPGDLTLHLEPLKLVVKQGEEIGMLLVFVGGTRETTPIAGGNRGDDPLKPPQPGPLRGHRKSTFERDGHTGIIAVGSVKLPDTTKVGG
jgi:hypothetical protein